MRPQISESETSSQKRNPGNKVSDLPHSYLKTRRPDRIYQIPHERFRPSAFQEPLLGETPEAK
jgi:hypothetical protein